jgi:hypothetical protein
MNESPTNNRMNLRPEQTEPIAAEEILVADARGALTPAQMVERKLVSMLQSAPLPVSRLQESSAQRRTLA